MDQALLARLLEVANEGAAGQTAEEEEAASPATRALRKWQKAQNKEEKEDGSKQKFHLISRRDMKLKVAEMVEDQILEQPELEAALASPTFRGTRRKSSPPRLDLNR